MGTCALHSSMTTLSTAASEPIEDRHRGQRQQKTPARPSWSCRRSEPGAGLPLASKPANPRSISLMQEEGKTQPPVRISWDAAESFENLLACRPCRSEAGDTTPPNGDTPRAIPRVDWRFRQREYSVPTRCQDLEKNVLTIDIGVSGRHSPNRRLLAMGNLTPGYGGPTVRLSMGGVFWCLDLSAVAGDLKPAYAQFTELGFAKFGTRLDDHTRKIIDQWPADPGLPQSAGARTGVLPRTKSSCWWRSPAVSRTVCQSAR